MPHDNADVCTNADRIRAMSTDELAWMLCKMTYCQDCKHLAACQGHSAEGYINWLNQKCETE